MNAGGPDRRSKSPHECRPSAACAYCARLTGVLTELATAIRSDAALAVPDEVVDAAVALFSARPASIGPAIVAKLVYDSHSNASQPEAAFGDGAARSLRFETAETVIDVRLSASDDRVSLLGRIRDRASGSPVRGAASAYLSPPAVTLAHAQITASGEFLLDYPHQPGVLVQIFPVGLPDSIEVRLDEGWVYQN